MHINFNKEDIMILDDNKQYVVVNYLEYDGNMYVYLCELGNSDNIKFVQVEDDKTISIVGTDETDLLKKLIFLFVRNN